jgi:transcriptional regulator with GAF, ATPase, and Fis domain
LLRFGSHADGGTLFLDEIGDLPIDLQAKLLRALQEKEIRPVGSTERVSISTRIIAATNRDLEGAVRQGGFRQDLFFRLNVVQIKLPPLLERKSDIPLLVSSFLEKFSEKNSAIRTISEDAMARLSQSTLAEMVGTTRPRVNKFMNDFRKKGLVSYNGGLKINSASLLKFLESRPMSVKKT